jgi:hypothetical protein
MGTTVAEQRARAARQREVINNSRLLHDYFYGRIKHEEQDAQATQPRSEATTKRRR